MSGNDGSQRRELEEETRRQNSNLQRLIEGAGTVLTASGALLTRLRRIIAGGPPAAMPPPAGDKPPDADHQPKS